MSTTTQKVAIFGGSSGIGLAASRALSARGYETTAIGRDPNKLARAVAGTSIKPAAVDAASSTAVQQFFQAFGPVDHVVITVSGSKGAGPLGELSAEDLREGFDTKFFAHWRIARAALPTLTAHGSITFVSAISARNSLPHTAGLAAINGAIEAIVKPLARELKPRRVNAISPGVIETPWWDNLPETQRDQLLTATAKATLVGRNGRAEEVADAIVFAVTNGFVTGTVIEIDGGMHLGN